MKTRKNASFSVRKVNVCNVDVYYVYLMDTIRTAYFNTNIDDNKTDEKQVARETN